jgi:hypothetical protein
MSQPPVAMFDCGWLASAGSEPACVTVKASVPEGERNCCVRMTAMPSVPAGPRSW